MFEINLRYASVLPGVESEVYLPVIPIIYRALLQKIDEVSQIDHRTVPLLGEPYIPSEVLPPAGSSANTALKWRMAASLIYSEWWKGHPLPAMPEPGSPVSPEIGWRTNSQVPIVDRYDGTPPEHWELRPAGYTEWAARHNSKEAQFLKFNAFIRAQFHGPTPRNKSDYRSQNRGLFTYINMRRKQVFLGNPENVFNALWRPVILDWRADHLGDPLKPYQQIPLPRDEGGTPTLEGASPTPWISAFQDHYISGHYLEWDKKRGCEVKLPVKGTPIARTYGIMGQERKTCAVSAEAHVRDLERRVRRWAMKRGWPRRAAHAITSFAWGPRVNWWGLAQPQQRGFKVGHTRVVEFDKHGQRWFRQGHRQDSWRVEHPGFSWQQGSRGRAELERWMMARVNAIAQNNLRWNQLWDVYHRGEYFIMSSRVAGQDRNVCDEWVTVRLAMDDDPGYLRDIDDWLRRMEDMSIIENACKILCNTDEPDMNSIMKYISTIMSHFLDLILAKNHYYLIQAPPRRTNRRVFMRAYVGPAGLREGKVSDPQCPREFPAVTSRGRAWVSTRRFLEVLPPSPLSSNIAVRKGVKGEGPVDAPVEWALAMQTARQKFYQTQKLHVMQEEWNSLGDGAYNISLGSGWNMFLFPSEDPVEGHPTGVYWLKQRNILDNTFAAQLYDRAGDLIDCCRCISAGQTIEIHTNGRLEISR